MIIVFVDTNFFIQYKHYSEIQWQDFFKNHSVVNIMITRTVREEIDNFKNQNNSRRAKLSKKTNSLFRLILDSPNFCYVDKTKKPEIQFSFCKDYSTKELESIGGNFDLNKNDHVIIASIKKFILENEDLSSQTYFITGDTNALITAKDNKINYFIPPESWFLAPETDLRDKEIRKLKDRIIDLEKNYPEFECKISCESQNVIEQNYSVCKTPHFHIDDSTYNYLNLVKKLETVFPIETMTKVEKQEIIRDGFASSELASNSSLNSFGLEIIQEYLSPNFEYPSKEDYEKYSLEYFAWSKKIPNITQNYVDISVKEKNYLKFSLLLKNSGFVPVNNFYMTVSVEGGFIITTEDCDSFYKKKDLIPYPPQAPEPKNKLSYYLHEGLKPSILGFNLNRLNSFVNVPLAYKKDRNEMYCSISDHTKLNYSCEEFLHKMGSTKVEFIILPDNTNNIQISLEVSGSNLRVPINKVYNIVRENIIECDVEEIIRELLQKSFPSQKIG